MKRYSLHLGNCLEFMKSLPSNCIDSIITDPPYGLKFMGKKWDYDVPSVEIWQECYRILKPGGHLLSFAGTRTYHRLVAKIEDAGFEIRDMIAWIYGQGFPKSHNISKALDKMATEEVKQWDGWGTALKPAIEPICLARKPLEGTVAENILKYGTGGINIDGCRVPIEREIVPINKLEEWSGFGEKVRPDYVPTVNDKGRFPANVIHDGSEEVIKEFPNNNPGCKPHIVNASDETAIRSKGKGWGSIAAPKDKFAGFDDNNMSAARFFYCAKASKKDRGEGNHHPTVKPIKLMRYLCKLITPPNGIIIDPFMGSGSTGKAAILEGFRFIGCELDEEYFEIAKKRIMDEY